MIKQQTNLIRGIDSDIENASRAIVRFLQFEMKFSFFFLQKKKLSKLQIKQNHYFFSPTQT